MKHIKYSLLLLILIPFVVANAKSCDESKVTIDSIEKTSIKGKAEEINRPTVNGKTIGLDLKMYEVNDSVTYNLVINNGNEEDFYINEDMFKTDSPYIEYTVIFNDSSNVVKGKSNKEITLVVSYKNEVDVNTLSSNTLDASNSLKLSMNTNDEEKNVDTIVSEMVKKIDEPIKDVKDVKNPFTKGSGIKLLLIVLLISVMLISMIKYNKGKYSKYLALLLFVYMIPIVYAACSSEIEVDAKVTIEKRFNGTGYIYLVGPYTREKWDFYPETGQDMSYLKEILPINKWCIYDVFDVNKENGYCEFDNKDACESGIGYCMHKDDGSYDSCGYEGLIFDALDECNDAVQNRINGGYVEEGELTCVKQFGLACDKSVVYEGEYTILSTFNEKAYPKLYVENYIVKESYLCFVTDKSYCLHIGDEYEESNREIIRQQEEWFNNNGGSCELSGSSSNCSGASYDWISIGPGHIALKYKDTDIENLVCSHEDSLDVCPS